MNRVARLLVRDSSEAGKSRKKRRGNRGVFPDLVAQLALFSPLFGYYTYLGFREKRDQEEKHRYGNLCISACLGALRCLRRQERKLWAELWSLFLSRRSEDFGHGSAAETEPYRGVVQLVHGMCEYKERYLHFMKYLARLGYVAVIHDHRGHGKSVKEEADLGYMYGGGAQALLADIGTVNRRLHGGAASADPFWTQHGLAGRACVLAQHDDCMDMLIVCGSPSRNPARPFGDFVCPWGKEAFGERHRSRLLEALYLEAMPCAFEKTRNARIREYVGDCEGGGGSRRSPAVQLYLYG